MSASPESFSRTRLKLACAIKVYDHIAPLRAGDVRPEGIDLTFDFTCLSSCKMSSPDATCAGSPSQPQCTPGNNLFGYMIVSTYERGTSGDLAGWAATNIKPSPKLDAISWGNAVEADKMADGRLIALTPHFVVILDVRSGPLDLEGEMASRLGTWKFSL